MVQIKVTPEMLEEVANRANNTRIALESIHNNLCNEIDRLCFQWISASNQQFVQMFNDARPKAFTAINSINYSFVRNNIIHNSIFLLSSQILPKRIP
ncbi:hypothetical protein MCCC1A01412_27165 [Bacillus anthracis]|nr:hypothetical protein MCCC1A01412_27165 [Bacillus anthracis]